jgi:hypothetical protein
MAQKQRTLIHLGYTVDKTGITYVTSGLDGKLLYRAYIPGGLAQIFGTLGHEFSDPNVTHKFEIESRDLNDVETMLDLPGKGFQIKHTLTYEQFIEIPADLEKSIRLKDKEAVEYFLNDNQIKTEVLYDIANAVKRYFPKAVLYLEIHQFMDWHEQTLWFTISPDLPPHGAFEKKKTFNHEWWYPYSRNNPFKDLIHIELGYKDEYPPDFTDE